jgi:protein tyrosine phosphatase (PTP) superfamily phosphohydrolase (DUF442 family)
MPSAPLLASLVLAGAVVAGCRGPSSEPASASYPAVESGSFGSMQNVSVADQVWFGSTPSAEDLELARRRGVHAVIDLSTPDEAPGLDVAEVCSGIGLAYHAPLGGVVPPDDAQVDEFLATLEGEVGQPTLLFCASGSRCATFLAIYRASRVGVPLDQALAEARRAGMRPQDEEFVRRQVMRLTGEAPSAAGAESEADPGAAGEPAAPGQA